MVWTNNDGLNIRFGLEKGEVGKGGELPSDGDIIVAKFKILGASVPATDTPIETIPEAGIPDNVYLDSVDLFVTTTFVGATATLDIGLFGDNNDGTYSTVDDNGIVAASAVAALVAGAKITGAGALIGTVLAGTGNRPLYVSSGYNTAAFTAGEADLVVRYRKFV